MARVEAQGLGAWRTDLLGGLAGRVLEIGAGTGASLKHYPPGVDLTLLEPVPEMRARLERRVAEHTIVVGHAEALPFDDSSFDVVVSCLVLCSVVDLSASLAEIHRVLRPDGRLVFIEHVGSGEPSTRRAQQFLNPLWRVIGRGCHLCRDTEAAIEAAGFGEVRVDRSDLPGGAWVVKAAIHGVASKVRHGST